jgi:hypothetical protein
VGSVDVVDALCAAHPGVRWSWVMGAPQFFVQRVAGWLTLAPLARAGADAFADLRAGKWKRSDEFLRRVHIFVLARAGAPPPDTTSCPQARAGASRQPARVLSAAPRTAGDAGACRGAD